MKELLEAELSHEFHCTLTATCHGKPSGKFVRHRLRLLHRWSQMHSVCAGAVGGGRAGGVGAAPSVSLDASGSVAACGLGNFRLASARCEAKNSLPDSRNTDFCRDIRSRSSPNLQLALAAARRVNSAILRISWFHFVACPFFGGFSRRHSFV